MEGKSDVTITMMSVEDILHRWFNDKQEGRRGEPMGPSAAHSCIRQQAYRQLGALPTDPMSTEKADVGTLIHLGVMQILNEQFFRSELATEYPVQVPGLDRKGSADIVFWLARTLVDVKTYGDRAFKARVEANAPYSGQWDQTDLYALGVNGEAGEDVIDTVQILAINRDTGEYATFTKAHDKDRALDVAAEMSLRQASIDEAKDALADPTRDLDPVVLAETFPREGYGPGRGMPCDWCPFMSQCWPVPFGDLSPQSATVVDNPEEVARWAGEYRQATANAKEWTDRKYAAQAFLQGITGSFGEWAVSQQAAAKDTDIPDVDAMIDLLTELGVKVPMVTKAGRKGFPRVVKAK
jgi:hypothetical protein